MRRLLGRPRVSPAELVVDDCGLPPDALQLNGIALGFFPAYGEETARQINAQLPRRMAVIGDYVQISKRDMSLNQITWHLDDVLAAQPAVYAPAVMPMDGLQSLDEAAADVIARRMRELNDLGITVWLRLAHEMNGDWMPFGRMPKEFIHAWRLVADRVRRATVGAPARTLMLWAPNVADSSTGLGGYQDYWPGAAHVDICGLSIYEYGETNSRISSGSFSDRFKRFYKLYGDGEGKPIVVAETSAPYRYYDGTDRPLPGGEDEIDIKLAWLEQIAGRATASIFPRLRAIAWFEYDKSEDGMRKDFRLVLGRPEVADAARAQLAAMST